MDKIINWFILLLIFVFDPLAVALVIATNKILVIEKNEIKPQVFDLVSEPLIPVYEIHEEPNILEDTKIDDFKYEEKSEIPPIVEEPIKEEIIIEKHKEESNDMGPIIPNGRIELNDIREKKQGNRGFITSVPNPQARNSRYDYRR